MKTWKIILLVLLFGTFAVLGTLKAVAVWGVQQGVDFVQEQQPSAKSVGDLIGKQYSQLRTFSAALDDTACKININESAQDDLSAVYSIGPDGRTLIESQWPEDARAEMRSLRWEHTTLLEIYSRNAADYNKLRTDVRTIADDIGLNVDYIQEAKELSPKPGMCGGFALPELP